jgi:signal transduction histidine kinase
MTKSETGTPTVLVVDDSLTVRMSLHDLFVAEGYDVRMAASGDEGLAIFHSENVDLLILDFVMEGKSGVDVLREIRAGEQLRWTPILLLTAVANRTELVECLDLGADDFVVKPWDERELLGRAKTLLRLNFALLESANSQRNAEAVNAELARRNQQLQAEIVGRERMELELMQAQKLESVGQLAAGMAHEINTPTQYVGDNTRFLKDGFGDLCTALDSLQKLLQAAKEGTVEQQIVAEVEATLKQADVEYLREEIPQAIDQSLDGIERVAKIVRAMKTFSHPGGQEKSLVNLTEAIETTITVARNEWKYVAEMVTEFEPELPQVSCLPGELNQVFLNLIINAAHAIGDALGDDATDKGTITVGTRRNGEWAEIFVRDTGTGIPEHVRTRIFDPFFTTKEVGKGTGQGLAIARSVVVDKHGGTLECETEQGKGTTFFVRLPIDAERQSQGAGNEYEDAGSLC